MRSIAKVGFVVAGYIAAWIIASAAVAAHVALTADDSHGADGMYAFGDGLLFLVVFCVVALVPTATAAYLLLVRKRQDTR